MIANEHLILFFLAPWRLGAKTVKLQIPREPSGRIEPTRHQPPNTISATSKK